MSEATGHPSGSDLIEGKDPRLELPSEVPLVMGTLISLLVIGIVMIGNSIASL